MRPIEYELAIPAARGLIGAASVDGGATAEQLHVISALLHGYFGVDEELAALEPLSPDEVADAIRSASARRRFMHLMIVLELCRHPAIEAQADAVEAYATALGIHDEMQTVARDAARSDRERMNADWARFREASGVEPETELNERLASDLRALENCPAGSLGRAYFDFYQRYDLPFPGEPGGGEASLIAHDFTHVLAGFEPIPVDELALQAMLTSATDDEHHFSGFVASLGLYESGMLAFPNITAKVGVMERAGAPEEIAEAIRRGAECGCDFEAVDHLGRAGESIDAVRTDLGIPPRRQLVKN